MLQNNAKNKPLNIVFCTEKFLTVETFQYTAQFRTQPLSLKAYTSTSAAKMCPTAKRNSGN